MTLSHFKLMPGKEDRKVERQEGRKGGRKEGRRKGREGGKERRERNSTWFSIYWWTFSNIFLVMIFFKLILH